MSKDGLRPVCNVNFACVGCGTCESVCPGEAMYYFENKDIYLVNVVKCCEHGPCEGECEELCPVCAIEFKNDVIC